AVANILVVDASRPTRSRHPHRVLASQCLNTRLLVDAEHNAVRRCRSVELTDLGDLCSEVWIRAMQPELHSMRTKVPTKQRADDPTPTDVCLWVPSHKGIAERPVGPRLSCWDTVVCWLATRHRDQLASQLRRIDGCTARPHSVLESLQAVGLIAKPQPPNPRLISPKPLRDTRDACAFAEHHQRSCSLHHGRRFATPLHGTQQLVPVLLPKHQPAWLGTPLRRR